MLSEPKIASPVETENIIVKSVSELELVPDNSGRIKAIIIVDATENE